MRTYARNRSGIELSACLPVEAELPAYRAEWMSQRIIIHKTKHGNCRGTCTHDDAVLLSLRVALFAFVRVFQFAPETFPPPLHPVTLAQSNKHVQLEKKL